MKRFLLILFLMWAPLSARAAEPDLAGQKGETAFFLLGMLDEYAGRGFVEDGDDVERFYCNEHIAAFVFRAYLARLAREQHLNPAVETRWRQDCLPSFHSPEISAFINQFYSYEFSEGMHAMTDQGPKAMASASLSASQLDGRDPALKLAYLAGAYFRYGMDGNFKFANSSQKLALIAHLLEEMGCQDMKTSSREGLPYQNDLSFTPTEEMRLAFERMPGSWALQAADSLVGLATADELSIYRAIIRAARRGDFDGCPLPASCVMNRFTFIPMARRGAIPASADDQREALEDYDRNCSVLRSVRDLAEDDTIVINDALRPPTDAWSTLSRVGFDRAGTTAVVLFFYREAGPPGGCGKSAAAFLTRREGEWEVTHYSVQESQ